MAAVLTDLYENHATTTYVLGVGDETSVAHLQNLACWGSGGSGIPCQGGTVDYFDSATLQELEATLQQIIESMSVDPCCPVVECLSGGSCSGAREPDPVPPSATTSETSDTAGAISTADTTMTSSDPTSGGSTSGTSTASDVDTSTTSITSSVTTDAPQTSGDASGPSSTADAGCGCAARDRTPFLPAGLLVLVLARARRRNEPPIRAP